MVDNPSERSRFTFATEETYLRSAEARAARRDHGVLTFVVGGNLYGLEIAHVREIIKVHETTEVPRVPGFLIGVITVRGTVIPVIDLRLRLRVETAPLGRLARILVVIKDNERFGLLVDAVRDVVRFSEDQIEPPPPSLAAPSETPMLAGIARYQTVERERMVVLLSLEALLTFDIAAPRGSLR
jgi:purine-binding chemotaxis protein CheW